MLHEGTGYRGFGSNAAALPKKIGGGGMTSINSMSQWSPAAPSSTAGSVTAGNVNVTKRIGIITM
jgi:hypothetical protein